ncbi:MAG: DUF3305 domain-containing protein, partial [Sedimenticolaceae bacterium]
MAQTHEPQGSDIRRLPVSVVLERRPAVSRWADHVWTAAGITVGRHADGTEAQLIREDQGVSYFLIGGLDVALYVDECESYYYNLVSDSPRAYVIAHTDGGQTQPHPFRVSMSFDEAHAYLEGDDEVYAVDVPAELYRWTEAFVIAHYFPQKKTKRKLRDWSADESG